MTILISNKQIKLIFIHLLRVIISDPCLSGLSEKLYFTRLYTSIYLAQVYRVSFYICIRETIFWWLVAPLNGASRVQKLRKNWCREEEPQTLCKMPILSDASNRLAIKRILEL